MLCDLNLLFWPYPSDHSSAPDFANLTARATALANARISGLSFTDVAYDGRRDTSLRLVMESKDVDLYLGGGKLNYAEIIPLDDEGAQPSPKNYYLGYFISSWSVVNRQSSAVSVSTCVVQLDLVYDIWMNSGACIRSHPDLTVLPSRIVRSHVDRWTYGSPDPSLYPVKADCDGWTEFERTPVKLADLGDDIVHISNPEYLAMAVIVWTDHVTDNASGLDYPSGKLHISGFIVSTYTTGAGEWYKANASPSHYYGPPLEDIMSGKTMNDMGVPSASVLNVSLLPMGGPFYLDEEKVTGLELYMAVLMNNNAEILAEDLGNGIYGYDLMYWLTQKTWTSPTLFSTVAPTKPTWTGVAYAADQKYEPAMFMSPYRRTLVVNGVGEIVMEVPDNLKGCNTMFLRAWSSAGGVEISFDLGDSYDTGDQRFMRIGIGGKGILSGPSCDVIKNEWLDYSLAQKQLDRSYRKDSDDLNLLSTTVSGVVGSLTHPTQAVDNIYGIVSSLYTTDKKRETDTEYNEQTIRNRPSSVAVSGDGMSAMCSGKHRVYTEFLKMDDVTMRSAFDRFTCFGYALDLVAVPNWTSRHYFNYIRTENARVVSPDRRVSEAITEILDKGITVYHIDVMDDEGVTLSGVLGYDNIEQDIVDNTP